MHRDVVAARPGVHERLRGGAPGSVLPAPTTTPAAKAAAAASSSGARRVESARRRPPRAGRAAAGGDRRSVLVGAGIWLTSDLDVPRAPACERFPRTGRRDAPAGTEGRGRRSLAGDGIDWIIVGLSLAAGRCSDGPGVHLRRARVRRPRARRLAGTRLGQLVLSGGAHSPWAPAFGLLGALLVAVLSVALEAFGGPVRRARGTGPSWDRRWLPGAVLIAGVALGHRLDPRLAGRSSARPNRAPLEVQRWPSCARSTMRSRPRARC